VRSATLRGSAYRDASIWVSLTAIAFARVY
jgi:hypothetical protein